MNIARFSEVGQQLEAQQKSRECRCKIREDQGLAVPCASCRVASFKRVNSRSREASWSQDITAPVGVSDAKDGL